MACEDCEEEAKSAPPVPDLYEERIARVESRLGRIEETLHNAYVRAYKIALLVRNGALIALWAVFCVLVWVL
jgi:hypothetical protein